MNTDSEKQLSWLAVKALDHWEQIKYYHEFLVIDVDNESTQKLYLHAYLELSKPYHKKLDSTLRKLQELTSGKLELE